ncbi:MAG: hypothetical protein QHI48_06195 [Bacteroidota bacterium]|nr:hypothetical protein [Bacteroidota bacterium]
MTRLYFPKRTLYAFLLAAALSSNTEAQQYPLQVAVTIIPPYSPLLSDWEAHPERIQLTVRNTQSNTYQFRLSGILENSEKTIRIWTKDNVPMQPFTIGPNGMLTLTGRDYNLFNQNQVDGSGVDRDQVARSGRLPEGSYTICAQALDYATLAPLSAPPPQACQFVNIQYAEVPQPISPVCASTVRQSDPQLVLFQWIAPVAGVPTAELANIRYELTIVPVAAGKTPESALDAPGDPAMVVRRDLISTLFSYDAMLPLLVKGTTYAWRVRAYTPGGRVAFRNDGKSIACSFVYGEPDKKPSVLCFTLLASEPTDRQVLTSSPVPVFRLRASPAISRRGIRGGRLRIWRMVNKDEDTASVTVRTPVYDKTFTGNGEDKVALNKGTGDTTIIELKFTQAEDAKFTTTKDTWYAWRFDLQHDSASIRADSVECMRGSTTSTVGRFSWSPCFVIEAVQPADTSRWTQSSKPLFTVKVSPGIAQAAVTGGTLNIWKIEDSTRTDIGSRFPDRRLVFSGNPTANLAVKSSSASETVLDLMYVNHPGAAKQWAAENGAWYLWDFTLEFDRFAVRIDREPCSVSTITSGKAVFRYDSIASLRDTSAAVACFRLDPVSPMQRGVWYSSNRPQFRVHASPAIVQNGITSGNLKIWEMNSPTEDTSSVFSRAPVYDRRFFGHNTIHVEVRPDSAGGSPVDLVFINENRSPSTESYKHDFTQGKTYLWRFTLGVDSATIRKDSVRCPVAEVTSSPGVFTFDTTWRPGAVSVAECVRLTALQPPDRGFWKKDSLPLFSLSVSPEIVPSAIRSGRLQVWQMTSAREDTNEVLKRSPVFDRSFTGSAAANIVQRLDSLGNPVLDLKFVNFPGAAQRFAVVQKKSYLWRFTMTFNPASIRKDTARCTRDTVRSALAVFTADSTASEGCLDVCSIAPPTLQTPGTQQLKPNDTLRVGRFTLKLVTVSGTPAALSGTGFITIPFMLSVKIAVEFFDVKVNANNEMYEGDIVAQQAEDVGLSKELANGLGDALGLTDAQLKTIYGVTTNSARLVSALAGMPAKMPLGFDNDIMGRKVVLGIIGMVFKPTAAYMNAVISCAIPEWGPEIAVGLGARRICISPAGIGGDGNVELYLPADLGYTASETWSFKFLAPKGEEPGCYVSLDCRGFKELHLSAQVKFPRTWLKPFPTDDGTSKVKAKFRTVVSRGGNFLAAASMDRCELAGVPGMVLEVQEMAIDKSDEANPAGIVFPDGYVGVKDNTWKGFFIKRASISLPPALRTFDATQPPQIAVQNLLITRAGITGSFRAENVFQYPRGNFGSWGGSLDTIGVEIVSSSLRAGWLKGRIQMPISDSPFKYTATLSRPLSTDTAKSLRMAFVIQPADTFKANIWMASIKLFSTSSITLGNDNPQRQFRAVAILNGSISIAGTIGPVPGVNLLGIGFQNMKLQSVKPYFTKGTFGFASPQKGLAGFPISISNIDLQNRTVSNKDLTGIKFSINVNFAPGSTAIGGSTTLILWGELDVSGGGQKFKYNSIELQQVTVDADLGPVKIKGSITFYRQDPVYGNGFRGAIEASVIQMINITATVQFGSVNNFRYFYVDARAIFNPGIPIGAGQFQTGTAFYGFGGGFWWNMRREGPGTPGVPTSSAVAGTTPGATVSGFRFVPADGVFGFKAMVVMGTYPSSAAFNADIVLEIELIRNTSTGGISMGRITLQGNGYMMTEITARQNAKVTMFCDLTYYFPQKTFHGLFTVNINAPPVTGGGQAVLHIESSTWYFKIGEPSSRFQIRLASWLGQVGAYLMMGKNLPPPLPPPENVRRIIGSPTSNRNTNIAAGNGFAFGADISFSTGRQTWGIFYGEFSAGGGFDIAVLKQNNCTGINKWQAQGQLYAYVSGSVGLYVDISSHLWKPCGPWYCVICKWCECCYFGYRGNFEILGISAAMLLDAGAPNPLWVTGTVRGNYNILGGLVHGSCTFKFSKGTECRI